MELTKNSSDAVNDTGYYYSIRLLITHPAMPVEEITVALGMEPTRAWNAGERQFTKDAMWSRTSRTEGKRLFFEEVHDVLEWLDEEHQFVSRLLSSGGELQVIAQLPGTINIGSYLSLETMALAVKLGVRIGIEVFPSLPRSA
ncbi:hypothetical protein ABIC94_002280 [Variovorax paradoxus]|uniref:DUF4279 domain-containing protein n=1 Tax=Variovorax paradoxus TaxID=34073 RepID=UPI0033953622